MSTIPPYACEEGTVGSIISVVCIYAYCVSAIVQNCVATAWFAVIPPITPGSIEASLPTILAIRLVRGSVILVNRVCGVRGVCGSITTDAKTRLTPGCLFNPWKRHLVNVVPLSSTVPCSVHKDAMFLLWIGVGTVVRVDTHSVAIVVDHCITRARRRSDSSRRYHDLRVVAEVAHITLPNIVRSRNERLGTHTCTGRP